jgi:hypothetical protein
MEGYNKRVIRQGTCKPVSRLIRGTYIRRQVYVLLVAALASTERFATKSCMTLEQQHCPCMSVLGRIP